LSYLAGPIADMPSDGLVVKYPGSLNYRYVNLGVGDEKEVFYSQILPKLAEEKSSLTERLKGLINSRAFNKYLWT
jgi:hypothetical protein